MKKKTKPEQKWKHPFRINGLKIQTEMLNVLEFKNKDGCILDAVNDYLLDHLISILKDEKKRRFKEK